MEYTIGAINKNKMKQSSIDTVGVMGDGRPRSYWRFSRDVY